ncbi:DDE superfamily endonuclease domain-containing protein [Ditylenchus destructor]|uniref:DDE superfamily endonuclease domain-containing protein n=1 Tax=Ditylenchus destructor TaxID=166010 RepID=A0AAD4R1M8_9BILA|nr:DDE superfamily endonuclease domain-containing protein [Ditylenchus destructor]
MVRDLSLDSINLSERWNRKAWMVTTIFHEWAASPLQKVRAQRRKIALIVDNHSSHVLDEPLANVEMTYLPPNTNPTTTGCRHSLLVQGTISKIAYAKVAE